ncbi:MAG: hypothetical protein AB1324_06640 [Candidatus Micrarchaeota archaeon]
MNSQHEKKAIASGMWHRSSFPPHMPLREQALSLIRRHVSVSDSKSESERECAERDLRNAVEVLRCQVEKDNEVLTALAHLAASSRFVRLPRMPSSGISDFSIFNNKI